MNNGTIKVSFKKKLNTYQAQSVLSKLTYSIENIHRCYIDEENEEIVIESLLNDPVYAEITEHLINLEKSKREFRPRVTRKNVTTESESTFNEREIDYSEFLNNELGELLLSKIDALFQVSAKRHEAKIKRYRSMIERETLEQCKYIHKFPQNLYLVSQFPHDINVLNKLRKDGNYEEYTKLSENVLSPAVCFHFYEEYKEKIISDLLVVSALEKCFRHEAKWRVNNYRKNEFTMREIVFVGKTIQVEQLRSELLEETWDIFNVLQLQGRIETASDPFYFVEDYSKGSHQLFNQMKFELVVQLSNKEEFSIASFNNVGSSLCEAFNIRSEDQELLQSGCVAFGLDRWAYALIVQHGINIEKWPVEVKQKLEIQI